MTNEELLAECKKGLNIPTDNADFDAILTQKMLAVRMFMSNAGVIETNMDNDLAIGVLVMGVSDLWELNAGEAKFSPVFYTLVNQLAMMG